MVDLWHEWSKGGFFMHFAIVEDTESDRKTLQELIFANCSRHGETVEFSFYPSGEAFLEAFHPGLFSAVFMDIMLDRKGKNGMETAKELRKTALRLPIIFTTTEPEFSLEGYEVHPLDYLLKPVDPVKLDWCLQELREFWAVPLSFEFPESSGQGTASSPRRVVLDDFCYAEKSGHWLSDPHRRGCVSDAALSCRTDRAAAVNEPFFHCRKGTALKFFAGEKYWKRRTGAAQRRYGCVLQPPEDERGAGSVLLLFI